MYNGVYPDYLYHHGILGMKWGKRNGPPYPLAPSDHSASERKAGWRKSLDGGAKRVREGASRAAGAARSAATNVKRGLQTPEGKKKALKAGLAIAGTALAVYGAYKLHDAAVQKSFNEYYNRHYDKYMDDVGRTWGALDAKQVSAADSAFGRQALDYAKSNNSFARAGNAVRTAVGDAGNAVRTAAGKAAGKASELAKKPYDSAVQKSFDEYYNRNYDKYMDDVGKTWGALDKKQVDAANSAFGRQALDYAKSNNSFARAGNAVRNAPGRVGNAVRNAADKAAANVEITARNAYSDAKVAGLRAREGVKSSVNNARNSELAKAAGRVRENAGLALRKTASNLADGTTANRIRNSELAKAAGRVRENAGVAIRKAASNAIDNANARATVRRTMRDIKAEEKRSERDIRRDWKRQERERRRR